jgi:flavin reductase (DIM6/NTAB) family NADH-FMN oxidoreductase RutF
VEQVYDARIRGACLNAVWDGSRAHLHGGCWLTACGYAPPRALVAFPREFEGATLVERARRTGRGGFTVSLLARDQQAVNDALFAGRHTLEALGRDRFLRGATGTPLLRAAVGYLDCRPVAGVDLGDFLVALGDVVACAALRPEAPNLTVNELLRRPGGGAGGSPRLPFDGFAADTADLAPAPGTDTPVDGPRLAAVYGLRAWGVCLVTVHACGRDHAHVTAWAVQCSHRPPRMLVMLPRGGPADVLCDEGGAFGLTLLARDQAGLVPALAAAGGDPRRVPALALRRGPTGCLLLRDGVGWFDCRLDPRLRFGHDGDHVGAIGEVVDFGWGRRDADQLRVQDLAGDASVGRGPGGAR